MYIAVHVKYHLCLSDFNETSTFLTDFEKIHWYQISWKSVQWEKSCDTGTDRPAERYNEINSRSSKFCERAKKRRIWEKFRLETLKWVSTKLEYIVKKSLVIYTSTEKRTKSGGQWSKLVVREMSMFNYWILVGCLLEEWDIFGNIKKAYCWGTAVYETCSD